MQPSNCICYLHPVAATAKVLASLPAHNMQLFFFCASVARRGKAGALEVDRFAKDHPVNAGLPFPGCPSFPRCPSMVCPSRCLPACPSSFPALPRKCLVICAGWKGEKGNKTVCGVCLGFVNLFFPLPGFLGQDQIHFCTVEKDDGTPRSFVSGQKIKRPVSCLIEVNFFLSSWKVSCLPNPQYPTSFLVT